MKLFLFLIVFWTTFLVGKPPIDLIPGGRGFYTGSFDPIHLMHAEIAEAAVRDYQLGKLTIVINATGVKDFKASTDERREMVRLATEHLGDKVEILVLDQEEKNSYINKIAKEEKNPIYCFLGDDSWNVLPPEARNEPGRRWVINLRANQKAEEVPTYGLPNISFMTPASHTPTSSTDVRKALALGEPSPELHPKVQGFIQQQGLYYLPSPEKQTLRQKEFSDSFDAFVSDLRLQAPQLNHIKFTLPPFDPQQSQSAWKEKFLNQIAKEASLTKTEKADLRRKPATSTFCGTTLPNLKRSPNLSP